MENPCSNCPYKLTKEQKQNMCSNDDNNICKYWLVYKGYKIGKAENKTHPLKAGSLLDSILDSTPGLRKYHELVQTVPEVKCVDCPLYTPKKNGNGGWCKVPYDKIRASVKQPDTPRTCLSHGEYVLKIPLSEAYNKVEDRGL